MKNGSSASSFLILKLNNDVINDMYALDMVIEIEISDLRQNYEKIQSALGLQTSQLKTEGANCFIGTTVLESVLRVGMFRTKWPPRVDKRFRTGRHSSQVVQKTECWNRIFQHWRFPQVAKYRAKESHY